MNRYKDLLILILLALLLGGFHYHIFKMREMWDVVDYNQEAAQNEHWAFTECANDPIKYYLFENYDNL